MFCILVLWLNGIRFFIIILKDGIFYIQHNLAFFHIEQSLFILFDFIFSKFRGSSTVVCIWAFGLFLIIGGALMIYLGYFVLFQSPFWIWPKKNPENSFFQRIPPIQIAGPILFGIGLLLIIIGLIGSISTSQVALL